MMGVDAELFHGTQKRLVAYGVRGVAFGAEKCEIMQVHEFAIPVLRVVAPRVAAHVITDDKDAPYRLQTFGNHQAKLFHWFGVVIGFVLLRGRAGGHPKAPSREHEAVFRWMLTGRSSASLAESLGEREVKRKVRGEDRVAR